jgi:hypothetical protein
MCVTWTPPKFYFLPMVMRTCTKPTEAQSFRTRLLKKCPALSGTARLITVWTGTRHWSPSRLPRSRWIHFTEYFCKDPFTYFLSVCFGSQLLKKYPAFYGTARFTGVPGGGGVFKPPLEIPKFWQSWAEISLKYQKLRKYYYMKWDFLYQITAASRTPD